jgi:TRAP-type C4-dicarboxylate transport system permease small subunit
MTVALALIAGAVLLFWCTVIGTRLAQPPRWTGDTIVMCFIAPLVIFLGASGTGILAYLAVTGAWRDMAPTDFIGVGAVLAAAAITGLLLARWSRRAPQAVTADVVPLQRPESPEPPNPLPTIGGQRRAA